jgi:trimeric autotransporter adhesin
LRADGTVIGWGSNTFGATTIPAAATNVVAIAAGLWHSLALRADGTVIGWGWDADGQVTIPAGLKTLPAPIVTGSVNSAVPGAYPLIPSP